MADDNDKGILEAVGANNCSIVVDDEENSNYEKDEDDAKDCCNDDGDDDNYHSNIEMNQDPLDLTSPNADNNEILVCGCG